MNQRKLDMLVIGAGPAGLAAAIEARKSGIESLLVIERDEMPGGILPQCIHTGFGLRLFGEELTGPEYIERFIEEAAELDIPIELNTMATELRSNRQVVAVGPERGMLLLNPKAVVLAMGCRERTHFAAGIGGSRPAGIYTAGAAQRMLNIHGMMPGREIVIVGSGDIGLIMARRLTLEGAHVKCVVERMPYPGGLTRNVVQCLHDFGIPLHLNHSVTEVRGTERVQSVIMCREDDQGNLLQEQCREIGCDTLLISAGLIPENELSRMAGIQLDRATMGPIIDQRMQTARPGIFACGDVAYVHNLVDWVTEEARIAGRAAARFIRQGHAAPHKVRVAHGSGVNMVVPQIISLEDGRAHAVISLRPCEIVRNAQILLNSQDGVTIHRTKRRIVRPAELFDIDVSSLDLSGVLELTITIEKPNG